MTLSQLLPQLLKTNLVTLREAPKNPNITSPRYNLNARCTYHSESPGHDTNNCWSLKNKVQYLIETKEIEFYAPEKPNVITAPMPKHGHGVNAVDDDLFVTFVEEIYTPLMTVKKPFTGKKEASAVYCPRGQSRLEHRQAVNAVVISRPTVAPQRNNQKG